MNDETEKNDAKNKITTDEIMERYAKQNAERESYLQSKIPTEIIGIDISIMEWIIILFKLNVAFACLVIPVFLLLALFSL
mgnify:FL=1